MTKSNFSRQRYAQTGSSNLERQHCAHFRLKLSIRMETRRLERSLREQIGALVKQSNRTASLTLPGLESTVQSMPRKTVAAAVVTVWLTLLGIEISEAAGLIDRMDKDRSVETETASFGVAFRALDDSRLVLSSILIVPQQVLSTLPDLNPSRLSAAPYVRKEARFLKEHFKIHKINRVLLI